MASKMENDFVTGSYYRFLKSPDRIFCVEDCNLSACTGWDKCSLRRCLVQVYPKEVDCMYCVNSEWMYDRCEEVSREEIMLLSL